MGVSEHSTLPSPLAPKIIRSRPTTPNSEDGQDPPSETQSKPKPKPARPPPPSRPTKPPTRPMAQPTIPGPPAAEESPVDGEGASENGETGRKITRQRPSSTAGVSWEEPQIHDEGES